MPSQDHHKYFIERRSVFARREKRHVLCFTMREALKAVTLHNFCVVISSFSQKWKTTRFSALVKRLMLLAAVAAAAARGYEQHSLPLKQSRESSLQAPLSRLDSFSLFFFHVSSYDGEIMCLHSFALSRKKRRAKGFRKKTKDDPNFQQTDVKVMLCLMQQQKQPKRRNRVWPNTIKWSEAN